MLGSALPPCSCKKLVIWHPVIGLQLCRRPRYEREVHPSPVCTRKASISGLVHIAGAQTRIRSAKNEEAVRQAAKSAKSSWNAKDAGAAEGTTADYLTELGRADYNINVDHGADLQVPAYTEQQTFYAEQQR